MIAELLQKSSLFSLLHRIDIDLAGQFRLKGCMFCGGPLHQANYERKPRGGPGDLPEQCLVRQSLCCGREGCRRRCLPPSSLFMGRRVYFAAVILVVMALRENRPDSESAVKLRLKLGISRKTFLRWVTYFRETFPLSRQWQELRGRVSSSVSNHQLPGSLLEYFIRSADSSKEGLVGCLQFLACGQAGL
jgi:hypothetical protein